MWRLATRPPDARRRAQRGQGLISTIAITSIVALLVLGTLTWARTSAGQSARSSRADIALQTAEAGVQQYVSRIVESKRFWGGYVDAAEDPRVTAAGATVLPGEAWPGGPWTYAGGATSWKILNTGRYGTSAYSLRVYPQGSQSLRVHATARVVEASGKNPVVRSIVATVKPLNLSDFQMVSDKTIRYGDTATTNGKVYSNEDVLHGGNALDTLYAQNYVCTQWTYVNCPGASVSASRFKGVPKSMDRTTIPAFRSLFRNPIDFSSFALDRQQFKQSAQAPGMGVYKNDASARGWMVQFNGAGQVLIWKITSGSAIDLERQLGTLGCPETVALRGGNLENFLYFEQPVVIGNGTAVATACDATARSRDSVVDGRVSISTSASIYIGGNISYQKPGRDVLGLMAQNSVVMATYAPYNLTWRAATLAETGSWRTAAPKYNGELTNTKGSLTFIGSIATAQGGYADMYGARDYQYDEQFTASGPPPQFPDIDGTWDVTDWREVQPPS